jgi:hypothetical protein
MTGAPPYFLFFHPKFHPNTIMIQSFNSVQCRRHRLNTAVGAYLFLSNIRADAPNPESSGASIKGWQTCESEICSVYVLYSLFLQASLGWDPDLVDLLVAG